MTAAELEPVTETPPTVATKRMSDSIHLIRRSSLARPVIRGVSQALRN